MGIESMNNFHNMVTRSQMSAPTFALPPTESASREFDDMSFRPIGAREHWAARSRRSQARSTVRWSLAAAIALAAAGCVSAPRQAESSAAPPTTHDDRKAAGADQAPASSSRTDFHEKATPRQQFQVHIDFGRAFEAQGNPDAAILEYQDALKVTENKRRGPFRPADQALAHRRIGGAMDRQGRFAQAETHYKSALKLDPERPQDLERRGL